MASEDKKTEPSRAPKHGVPLENKIGSGVDLSRRVPKLPGHPPPTTAGVRARSQFLKPAAITGLRFSRRRESAESSALQLRPSASAVGCPFTVISLSRLPAQRRS